MRLISKSEWKRVQERLADLEGTVRYMQERVRQLPSGQDMHNVLMEQMIDSMPVPKVVQLILDHFRLHIHVRPTAISLREKGGPELGEEMP